ncbi:GAF domain-containing protein [Neptunomonas sp.]|uniref:GAF domain-containing protein n=1 Tax=Neptunomonas sp. TaxID=1971898 RepID=UPI0025E38638|nr:GAF domain-containing protein [Neptunomonas sp.]
MTEQIEVEADSDFIDSVLSLSNFLHNHENIDASLNELAGLLAKTLKTENCSIMLLKDEHPNETFPLRIHAHSGTLPSSAYTKPTSASGISEYVARSGKPLLVPDITLSQFAATARQSGGFISLPIWTDEVIIGVINISKPSDGRTFGEPDLELATILGMFVSKSIQVLHLQYILRSKFAIAALEREQNVNKQPIGDFTRSPEKVAKILAKGFYHELCHAGIESDHIIIAVSEIITLLNTQLEDNKKHQ